MAGLEKYKALMSLLFMAVVPRLLIHSLQHYRHECPADNSCQISARRCNRSRHVDAAQRQHIWLLLSSIPLIFSLLGMFPPRQLYQHWSNFLWPVAHSCFALFPRPCATQSVDSASRERNGLETSIGHVERPGPNNTQCQPCYLTRYQPDSIPSATLAVPAALNNQLDNELHS